MHCLVAASEIAALRSSAVAAAGRNSCPPGPLLQRRRLAAPPAAAWARCSATFTFLPSHGGGSASTALPPAAWAAAALPATAPVDAAAFFSNEVRRRDLGAVSPALAGRFYQRPLPTAQVPFASEEGRQRFREALEQGYMENYFLLAEQFRTQEEPTFCGLSTLQMVLDAIGIGEHSFCRTIPSRVREAGLTFDGFVNLAGCTGADISAHRAPHQLTPLLSSQSSQQSPLNSFSVGQALPEFTAAFRDAVRATCRSFDRECLVICYSREAIGQTGTGHFSPIGGYHQATDSILILDVASFKYPPHWVRLYDVAAAMAHIDPDTQRTRGFMRLRPQSPASGNSH